MLHAVRRIVLAGFTVADRRRRRRLGASAARGLARRTRTPSRGSRQELRQQFLASAAALGRIAADLAAARQALNAGRAWPGGAATTVRRRGRGARRSGAGADRRDHLRRRRFAGRVGRPHVGAAQVAPRRSVDVVRGARRARPAAGPHRGRSSIAAGPLRRASPPSSSSNSWARLAARPARRIRSSSRRRSCRCRCACGPATSARQGPNTFAISAPGGRPLIDALVSPADLADARARWRDGVRAAVLSIVGPDAVVVRRARWSTFGGATSGARSLRDGDRRAAGHHRPGAGGRVVCHRPRPWPATRCRRPVDLLLTAFTAVAMVWVTLDTIERWRAAGPRPRLLLGAGESHGVDRPGVFRRRRRRHRHRLAVRTEAARRRVAIDVRPGAVLAAPARRRADHADLRPGAAPCGGHLERGGGDAAAEPVADAPRVLAPQRRDAGVGGRRRRWGWRLFGPGTRRSPPRRSSGR